MNNLINKGFHKGLEKFSGNKKTFAILAVLAVLMLGFFLRAYNFSAWQHFELDQSRDAKVIDLAIENGAGDLPLLGPKAAGSFLRLGPIFYYFGYLSAKIFGNNPTGIATITLIFSCLTLPLFYLFVRRFFDRKISILLLAIFSSSIFLVLYSRFSWNPNNLPFFTLAILYALLRATDVDEKRKGWWLVGSFFALAIATQLHFVAFLGFPTIVAAYLLVKRPSINWKFWLLAMASVVFLYVPPIVNDFKTGGTNIAEFAKVFAKKSNNKEHNLIEKAIRGVDEISAGYVLLLSGDSKADLPRIKVVGMRPSYLCDEKCVKGLPMGIVSLVFFLTGIALLGWNVFSVKDAKRKDFLMLMTIWVVVSMALFTPIAYDLAPRFLLLIAPIPFVLLGLMLNFFEKRKIGFLSWIFVVILIASNGWALKNRFQELGNASKKAFEIKSDKILKENERVTLEQQLLIIDHLENVYAQNKFPVYVNSEAFYRRAFLYHLEQRSIVRDDFRNTKEVYAQGNYFLIYPTTSSVEEITENYVDKYEIGKVKEFGTLQVVQLIPKKEAVSAVRQEFAPEKKPTSAFGVPVRCRWNEILGQCNTDGTEAEDETEI